MDERTRQALKGQIVSILFEAGAGQINLSSRIACEGIANDILKAIMEEESTSPGALDRSPESFG